MRFAGTLCTAGGGDAADIGASGSAGVRGGCACGGGGTGGGSMVVLMGGCGAGG